MELGGSVLFYKRIEGHVSGAAKPCCHFEHRMAMSLAGLTAQTFDSSQRLQFNNLANSIPLNLVLRVCWYF